SMYEQPSPQRTVTEGEVHGSGHRAGQRRERPADSLPAMGAWGVRGIRGIWGVMAAAVVTAGLVVAPLPVVSPAQAATVVPCPYVATPAVPPAPPSPVRAPAAPVMGGADLGASGLIVPPGVAAPPTLSAMSWVVADLDTGAVVAACSPHMQRRPASVQKL